MNLSDLVTIGSELSVTSLQGRIEEFFIGGGGKVQILVQKGLLNFFIPNYFPSHLPPLVTEKAETTTCFSICQSQLP